MCQLSLAVLSWESAVSTSQREVTLRGWGVKAGMFVQVKLGDRLVTYWPHMSALEIKGLYIKRYINSSVYFFYFLPRCMQCRRGIVRRILSVRPSVRLSVRPSVTRVIPDKTEERSVQIFIPYERTFILVF